MHGVQQHLWMHAESLQKYTWTRIYTYTYTYITVHIHTQSCIHITHIYICVHIYTHIYMDTYTYTYAYIYTYTYILIYIYSDVHKYIYISISMEIALGPVTEMRFCHFRAGSQVSGTIERLGSLNSLARVSLPHAFFWRGTWSHVRSRYTGNSCLTFRLMKFCVVTLVCTTSMLLCLLSNPQQVYIPGSNFGKDKSEILQICLFQFWSTVIETFLFLVSGLLCRRTASTSLNAETHTSGF